ncbi:heat shock trehalose synthase [Penicillium canescens]|uniref:Heat shock trehalose synthase n=1 Tax=Penicillium canescens TaxID=5083 RepID=A0AAD6IAX1_PENCN|nr:heat shock trehalose synthase [Penicillium canescens]KAJ6039566.1 heat shock trehalose synthase [Penicillium canescens]
MYKPPTYGRPISRHTVAGSRPHLRADSWSGQQFDCIYIGISGLLETSRPKIAIVIRDAAYLVDYLEYEFGYHEVPVPGSAICDSVIVELERYSKTYLDKIAGVAFPKEIHDRIPNLCSRLWMELDCFPLALDQYQRVRQRSDHGNLATFRGWSEKSLDEQADSMARKCIRYPWLPISIVSWILMHLSLFGVDNIPHFDIGVGGSVEIDNAFHAHIASARDFENSVTPETWSLAQHYASDLKERGVKIAIFSATPQNTASANTKSALLRLSHCLGTSIRWYIPDPSPKVSRVVEKMQKMLEGISTPENHLTTDEELQLLNWVYENAQHHWLRSNGPLRQAQDGGADVVIVDDPILSVLALISKQHDPKRPVIFHSRINMRIDPAVSGGLAKTEVFDFIWRTLQHADILACQALSTLESRLIPGNKVGYMLATVDKFDGLNKDMNDFDLAFYGRQFNASCRETGTTIIDYPDDEYMLLQMPHRPSLKPTLSALEAYREFCTLMKTSSAPRLPKLLLYGHQVNDHANKEVYDAVATHITLHMNDLVGQISIKLVRPPDQIWNTLLSKATLVILLSDVESFEEGFLEAVQKGKPVITTQPLGPYRRLVENDPNIFTVEITDANSMAEDLFKIWTDSKLKPKLNISAPNKTWDEVTTVGNAVNWLFLASELSKGKNLEPNGEYIYQLAKKGKTEANQT